MHNFKMLLVLPAAIGIAVALIIPNLTGLFLGVVATLLYFAVTVARASDWH